MSNQVFIIGFFGSDLRVNFVENFSVYILVQSPYLGQPLRQSLVFLVTFIVKVAVFTRPVFSFGSGLVSLEDLKLKYGI